MLKWLRKLRNRRWVRVPANEWESETNKDKLDYKCDAIAGLVNHHMAKANPNGGIRLVKQNIVVPYDDLLCIWNFAKKIQDETPVQDKWEYK